MARLAFLIQWPPARKWLLLWTGIGEGVLIAIVYQPKAPKAEVDRGKLDSKAPGTPQDLPNWHDKKMLGMLKKSLAFHLGLM
jgi:hypothetical protein